MATNFEICPPKNSKNCHIYSCSPLISLQIFFLKTGETFQNNFFSFFYLNSTKNLQLLSFFFSIIFLKSKFFLLTMLSEQLRPVLKPLDDTFNLSMNEGILLPVLVPAPRTDSFSRVSSFLLE